MWGVLLKLPIFFQSVFTITNTPELILYYLLKADLCRRRDKCLQMQHKRRKHILNLTLPNESPRCAGWHAATEESIKADQMGVKVISKGHQTHGRTHTVELRCYLPQGTHLTPFYLRLKFKCGFFFFTLQVYLVFRVWRETDCTISPDALYAHFYV